MKKKLTVVLVLAAVVLGIWACVRVKGPVIRVQNKMQPVMIDGAEQIRIGMGTGFFVSRNGVAITAAHVLEDYDKVFALHTGRETFKSVSVLLADHDADLAILKVSRIKVKNPLHFCVDLALHEPLAAYAWRSYGREKTRGLLIGSRGDWTWVANIIIGPGFSGGPIYSEENKCVAGVTLRSNMDSARPAMLLARPERSVEVMRMLRRIAPKSVKGLKCPEE